MSRGKAFSSCSMNSARFSSVVTVSGGIDGLRRSTHHRVGEHESALRWAGSQHGKAGLTQMAVKRWSAHCLLLLEHKGCNTGDESVASGHTPHSIALSGTAACNASKHAVHLASAASRERTRALCGPGSSSAQQDTKPAAKSSRAMLGCICAGFVGRGSQIPSDRPSKLWHMSRRVVHRLETVLLNFSQSTAFAKASPSQPDELRNSSCVPASAKLDSI